MLNKTELTNEEIKELVESYVAYQKAKDLYESTKERLTEGLAEGTYVSEVGKVVKSTYQTNSFQTTKFKAANPDLYNEYVETRESSKVTVTNYSSSDSKKKSWF